MFNREKRRKSINTVPCGKGIELNVTTQIRKDALYTQIIPLLERKPQHSHEEANTSWLPRASGNTLAVYIHYYINGIK